MSDRGAEGTGAHARRRGKKHRHKRKTRKHDKLLHNLKWMAGGIAVGLPMLAVVLYAVSRY